MHALHPHMYHEGEALLAMNQYKGLFVLLKAIFFI